MTITRDDLRQYRRVTVMGLGLFGGGAGAAHYFADLGARVTVTDMADATRLAKSVAALADCDIEYTLGGHRERDFTDADLVVANQAVRPENSFLEKARAAGVPIVTETGLALALNRSPWAAVTGSNGKSTTASLLAAMLSAHDPNTLFGGNIGGDLMTRVEGRSATSPLVVELSSFQLTYVGDDLAAGRVAPPRVAVVTNLAPNHLDWHRDFAEYVEAKRSPLRRQSPDDWAVLNVDDPLLAEWADASAARVVRCAFADPAAPDACFLGGGEIVLRLGGETRLRLPLAGLRLRGRHNVGNAMQAAAAAFAMCENAAAMAAGLADFPGLPHRLQTVAAVAGRAFVNDSKATTPDAARLALAAIPEPKVLIAGGYDKRSPFEELGVAIQESATGVVLLGAAGPRLREAILAAASRRPAGLGVLPLVECGDDFEQAVREAYRMTPAGGVVLLSPACASYGMFVNYEERGRVFGEIAARLEAEC